jgi:hypothetical protein
VVVAAVDAGYMFGNNRVIVICTLGLGANKNGAKVVKFLD